VYGVNITPIYEQSMSRFKIKCKKTIHITMLPNTTNKPTLRILIMSLTSINTIIKQNMSNMCISVH